MRTVLFSGATLPHVHILFGLTGLRRSTLPQVPFANLAQPPLPSCSSRCLHTRTGGWGRRWLNCYAASSLRTRQKNCPRLLHGSRWLCLCTGNIQVVMRSLFAASDSEGGYPNRAYMLVCCSSANTSPHFPPLAPLLPHSPFVSRPPTSTVSIYKWFGRRVALPRLASNGCLTGLSPEPVRSVNCLYLMQDVLLRDGSAFKTSRANRSKLRPHSVHVVRSTFGAYM